MGNNTVRARLALSFKGETYALDSVIDLDKYLGETGAAPNVHQLLARTAAIDPYSYLYEVLEAYAIAFSDATGGVLRSCREVRFRTIRRTPRLSRRRPMRLASGRVAMSVMRTCAVRTS